MRPRSSRLALCLVTAALLAVSTDAQLSTRRLASGLQQPIWAGAPEGDARIFIALQGGEIKILKNGAILPTDYLDVSGQVLTGSERGLLGVAFHPDYANNGYVYVDYTRSGDGATVVSRWTVMANDPDQVDPTSELVIMTVAQPAPNHNAGAICFGPNDGYLYITMGDGGSSNDPNCNAQKLGTRLGKILRVDVDGGTPYAIPADNPFVGNPEAEPEIFHRGLRNPWRVSFDSATGDLYIGDVGQNAREEISYAPAGSSALNFGWKVLEGTRCNQSLQCPVGTPGCASTDFEAPIWELFSSAGSRSIIGGYVYNGCAIPSLVGTYFFADYFDDKIRSFVYNPGTGMAEQFMDRTAELDPPGAQEITNIASFGEDGFGELLIVDRTGSSSGELYKVVPAVAVDATNVFRNGSGVNTACLSTQSEPILGNVWKATVEVGGHPGATLAVIVAYPVPTSGVFLSGGEALVDTKSGKLFQLLAPVAGSSASFEAPLPCDPSLNGAMGFTQGVILGGGWELCNAVDLTLGFF